MAKEREYVVVDDFANYADIKTLKAVVKTLESESAEVLAELRQEILKRTQEMLADAAEAGVVLSKPAANPKQPKGKKKDSVAPEAESLDVADVVLDAE